jgi:hypothetical protein
MKAVKKSKKKNGDEEPKSSASNVKNNVSSEGTYGMGDGHVPFMM